MGEHIRNAGHPPDEVEAKLKEERGGVQGPLPALGRAPRHKEKDADPMAEGTEVGLGQRYRRSPEEFEAEAGPAGRGDAQSS